MFEDLHYEHSGLQFVDLATLAAMIILVFAFVVLLVYFRNEIMEMLYGKENWKKAKERGIV